MLIKMMEMLKNEGVDILIHASWTDDDKRDDQCLGIELQVVVLKLTQVFLLLNKVN